MHQAPKMTRASLRHRILLAVAVAAGAAALAMASPPEEVKVTVYEGPTECSNDEEGGDGDGAAPTRVERDYVVGLHFTVTVDESSVGSRATVGKKIESSHDMGVAPSFPVGHGKVIPGLDRGLIGLCRGSKARIVVPPRLAYGRAGKPAQGVGPDATLMYDVEVVDVRPPVPNDFAKIDANGDWKIGRGEARRYFEGLGQGIDLDALWEAEDEDDDGYISWEEFTGPKGTDPPPPKPEKRRKGEAPPEGTADPAAADPAATDMVALFRKLDADADGKLSRSELSAGFRAAGRDMPEEFWAESDPDGDGYVLLEEFAGGGGTEGGGRRTTEPEAESTGSTTGGADEIAALFRSMDADGDGRIDRAELGSAFAALGQEMTEEFWTESDPDGDGYVTFEEFVGAEEVAGRGQEL